MAVKILLLTGMDARVFANLREMLDKCRGRLILCVCCGRRKKGAGQKIRPVAGLAPYNWPHGRGTLDTNHRSDQSITSGRPLIALVPYRLLRSQGFSPRDAVSLVEGDCAAWLSSSHQRRDPHRRMRHL